MSGLVRLFGIMSEKHCIYWERSAPQAVARESRDIRERRDLKFEVPKPSDCASSGTGTAAYGGASPLRTVVRLTRPAFLASLASLARLTFHVSRTAWPVMGLVWLLGLCTLCVSESEAMDIAILQSSDIAAYREAIAGLKATGPIGAIYTEYDAQSDHPGLQINAVSRERWKGVPQQLRALLSEVEALWLIPDSTVLTNESIRFILESALGHQIPVIGFSPEFTRLGALLSISVNYGDVGRETGLLAKRILDGERLLPLNPVPIERLKITVNLKTARFLGITFPKELTSPIDATY